MLLWYFERKFWYSVQLLLYKPAAGIHLAKKSKRRATAQRIPSIRSDVLSESEAQQSSQFGIEAFHFPLIYSRNVQKLLKPRNVTATSACVSLVEGSEVVEKEGNAMLPQDFVENDATCQATPLRRSKKRTEGTSSQDASTPALGVKTSNMDQGSVVNFEAFPEGEGTFCHEA